ncbi:hypothetical protein L249_2747 [Ophiocordyceps polyrhachis-furcata BCC 54312]|uniref:Uncharacterized protein n=1 Tax=Ophiocordyceps polyrhachis-furcata BCC 54312 TaxID=1330021 RepID=A0A367LPJ8_9HYPO|nr:hypothetical protein L249_2747 [Ophiocordyceps polyrhachis-furcata BCC 54312]
MEYVVYQYGSNVDNALLYVIWLTADFLLGLAEPSQLKPSRTTMAFFVVSFIDRGRDKEKERKRHDRESRRRKVKLAPFGTEREREGKCFGLRGNDVDWEHDMTSWHCPTSQPNTSCRLI